MKRNYFLIELIKSPPFLIFIILTLVIVLGVIIGNHKDKVVKMKEDILYVAPKQK
jgi:tetrahydromethanopterin S-methyltransferase subunit C